MPYYFVRTTLPFYMRKDAICSTLLDLASTSGSEVYHKFQGKKTSIGYALYSTKIKGMTLLCETRLFIIGLLLIVVDQNIGAYFL